MDFNSKNQFIYHGNNHTYYTAFNKDVKTII